MECTEQEIREFKAESSELLDVAERGLLDLDGGADFQKSYDLIFRSFHNLKGSAGMMGFEKLQTVVHQLETSFTQFKGAGSIPKKSVDEFLKGIDESRKILDGNVETVQAESVALVSPPIEVPTDLNASDSPAATVSDVVLSEFVSECEEISQRISINFSLLEKGTGSNEMIDSIYRDIHSLKGAAQLFNYPQLGDLAHAMESSMEPVRDKKEQMQTPLLDTLFTCMSVIDQMIERISSKRAFNFEPQLAVLIPQLSQEPSPIEALPMQGEQGPTPVAEAPKLVMPAPKPVAPPTTVAISHEGDASTIRVQVGLLDRLMTLMGEMVLVRNQVLQYASRSSDLEFSNLSQRLNVVTADLQGEMMKTRMQPIGGIANKFHRVVRDLAKDLGKKIDFEISGAETELDKTLLEAVKDPLTHIIRNSCDHGIETPEQRLAANKSAEGKIAMRAFHEGGQVIIEIRDDGKGLERERIVAKAIEKGLLAPEKAESLSEREVFNLIFAPGFSTAASVTNVSGRGVGMDVVRNNIERIGGSIELTSVFKKGMCIRLKIPLTLAIVPAMLARCGDECYAIPQLKLVELVRVEPNRSESKIEYLQGKPVYRLRGKILPLIDLKGVLKLSGAVTEGELPDAVNIVVLNADSQCFGLVVDEILDTADIVVKPLSPFLKALSIYSGATVLGDGSIALILDVQGLAQHQMLNGRKESEDREMQSAHDIRLKTENRQDFLMFNLSSTAKHAVFLGYVHRIEEFKRNAIEYSGDQAAVRYGGGILPIISGNKMLGYPERDQTSDVVPVIVTKKGDHYYGIEVNEILDVFTTEEALDVSLAPRTGIMGNLSSEKELIVVVDPWSIVPASKKTPAQVNLAKTLDAAPFESQRTQPTSSSVSILFVEDTSFFRKHISALLVNAGHRVTVAKDGMEAMKLLESAKKGEFDMILSDIEMPKMGGLQLARTVRVNPTWKDTPLMAITTRSERNKVEEGLNAGFDAYLEKINPTDLLGAIGPLISGKRGTA